MKRTLTFSSRNIKEMLRDPISWIFCVGMPIFMMGMFRFILFNIMSSFDLQNGITAEQAYEYAIAQGTPDFRALSMTPGIAVFSFSFVMLFAALSFSKDRCSSFLTRLYSSPMKVSDYILGYTLPFLIVGFFQVVICFIMGFIFGLECTITNMLLCFVVLIPSCIYMIGFGLLFGAVLNDKAAPGACSAIITLAGIASGAWFDVSMNNTLDLICHIMPFANSVDCARAALSGNTGDILVPFLITCAYALATMLFATLVFKKKMVQK